MNLRVHFERIRGLTKLAGGQVTFDLDNTDLLHSETVDSDTFRIYCTASQDTLVKAGNYRLHVLAREINLHAGEGEPHLRLLGALMTKVSLPESQGDGKILSIDNK